MTKLVTIFNPKDPTPTAATIRSHDPSEVHILLVGHDHYNAPQQESLTRFKSWVAGSMRPSEFPEHIWLDALDWPSLEDLDITIHYHSLTEIEDFDFTIIGKSITVDFLSGSKEMCVSLMAHCQSTPSSDHNIRFTVTQLTGSIIDIKSGMEIKPNQILSLTERIWLSLGKIAKTKRQGDYSTGKKIKNWEQEKIGKKIFPKNKEKLADFLNLNKDERDFTHGYWLEHYSANVISSWPDVLESSTQLHIIPASWYDFVGASFSNMSLRPTKTLGYPHEGVTEWPYGYDENGRRERLASPEKYREWLMIDQMHFLENASLNDDQLDHLWSCGFVNDIDAVALLENGLYIFIECKHKNLSKKDLKLVVERVQAISTAIAPRSSIPVVVHSGDESGIDANTGVFLIRWSDLSKPLIGVNSDNHNMFKVYLETENTSPKSNVEVGSKASLDGLERVTELLGEALISIAEEPNCSWEQAATQINGLITQEEKKKYFGSKKFKIKHARKYLKDYISIEGEGKSAILKKAESKNLESD